MTAKRLSILDVLLVALNLLCIAFWGSGIWNAIAAVVLTVLAVNNYRDWRDEVAAESRWLS